MSLIRVSYGTAICLGLIEARQETPQTTAYLLADHGCQGTCSYCPRAGGNQRGARLSRILWPEFSWDLVLRLLADHGSTHFRRVCLQTSFAPGREADLLVMGRQLLTTGLRISMTVHPGQPDFARQVLDAGLDHVGVGLDAASAKTYQTHKGRAWEQDWPSLQDLITAYGPRIETHLIFGLGDTEEACAATMDRIMALGGDVSLFAYTPIVWGNPPSLGAYRRLQAFRFLRQRALTTCAQCTFVAGRIKGFGLSAEALRAALADGTAFRTSGCGACNRPNYNEKPGRLPFNYPRVLTPAEAEAAVELVLNPEKEPRPAVS